MSETLKNVLWALYEPLEMIMVTFALFLMLMYVFTLFAFYNFQEDYDQFGEIC